MKNTLIETLVAKSLNVIMMNSNEKISYNFKLFCENLWF